MCSPGGSRKKWIGKTSVQCCLKKYSWDKVTQVKTLSNNVLETQDNKAQEKIVFNVVLTVLGQHYTGKSPVQCCHWGSRQQCTGTNPVQYCLNTRGITLYR